MTGKRIVVVGADAAGGSAAAQAKRADPRLEVVVLERQRWSSYSACGIPYWIAGDVADVDSLIARTPEQHRANGLDLRMETTVTAVDPAARTVTASGPAGDFSLQYDELVLGTGALPVRPAALDADNVLGVQTIDDGLRVLDEIALASEASMRPDTGRGDGGPLRAVVVGGGYVGIEMAEAMKRRGFAVTLVDAAPEPMSSLDPDMGQLVREAMVAMGIDVRAGTAVDGLQVDDDGRASAVLVGGQPLPCDLVVLGLGVRPNTELAVRAGLPIGVTGGIVTDRRQRVADRIWAAGDCVETRDLVSGLPTYLPLGTHANKQGRVVGVNLGGGYLTFPGAVGTAASKVCSLEVARTGLREADAERAGFEAVAAVIRSSTAVGYMPESSPMTVKMLAERGTGRILGVQIVGSGPGSAKRIDAAALAITAGMTASELVSADLSYAPPFSPVWDPVQVAARRVERLV